MQHVDIRVLSNGNYQLLEPIIYINGKFAITVARGFTYDGASIPRHLWEEVGCPMDYAFASAIHDALYRSRLLARKDCDKIFHSALVDSGVSKVKAKAMYLAVRLGGQEPYDDAIHMMAHYRNYVSIMPKV